MARNNHVIFNSKDFLPDLGKHLQKKNGQVQVVGYFCISAISKYNEEYYSITGGCSIENQAFLGTLDFTIENWGNFVEHLRKEFYLDVLFPKTKGHHVLHIEPSLPVWIDSTAHVGASTQSVITKEDYIPIVVSYVTKLRRIPTIRDIEHRHAWWVDYSSHLLEFMGEHANQFLNCMEPTLPYHGTLKVEKFQRYLLAFFLIRQMIGKEPLPEVMAFMEKQGWIKKSNIDRINQIIETTHKVVSNNQNRLTNVFTNLLIWYIALRIEGGAKLGTIESELVKTWGSRNSVMMLINEARYSIARPSSLKLPSDTLEKAILTIEKKNKGFLKVLKHRLARYSDEVWQHPELHALVEPYVRYDLLRQIHRLNRYDFVNNKIAQRCEENIVHIAEWLKMFTQVEMSLFFPTDEGSTA